MSKRGRPPTIESQKIIDAILEQSKNIIISPSGNIVDKNDSVWTRISKNLNNLIVPHSLYAYVTDNRFQLKSLLFDREGLCLHQSNSSINDTTVEESAQITLDSDISLHENVGRSYVIYLTKEEFKKLIIIKSKKCRSRTANRKKTQYKVLAPGIWEDLIFDRLVETCKITCGLSFRNHSINWDEYSGSFEAYCNCGGTCNGIIKNDPSEKMVEITCSMTKGNGKCGKRWVRNEKRKKVLAEMGEKTVHAYRSEKAANVMEFDDNEPPNLPSSPVLRNARYENRKKKFIHADPIKALQILKHTEGKFIIKNIGLDPFFVHYWTRNQLGMYKNYVNKGESCLCIDATGGLFKPMTKYDDIKSNYIYLYHGVIRLEAGQFPIVQMISESQNSEDIRTWLSQWVQSGAPPPREIVIDGGRALLTGAVRTFTTSFIIHEYADSCYGSTVPPCYIRIDSAHYIKTWVNLLKHTRPRISTFYNGVIGRLIICTDRTEAKTLVRNILILSQCETYGQLDDGTDTAAEKAYKYLKAAITGVDLSIIDYERSEELDSNGEDHRDDDNNAKDDGEDENQNTNKINKRRKETNKWSEWGNEANEEVRLLKINETGDRENAHYNPAVAKKLLEDLPDLPLWSCVTRNDYGFGRIPASSAPVESDFNLVKNSFFKNIVLPMRVDEFVQKFLKFLDGKLKLIQAQINELDSEVHTCEENAFNNREDRATNSLINRSSDSTKCPACIRNNKPTRNHKCFICAKPIHNLDACSVPLNREEDFGQKRICLSCNNQENVDIILASKHKENWGGKTITTSDAENDEVEKRRALAVNNKSTRNQWTRINSRTENSNEDSTDIEQILPLDINENNSIESFKNVKATPSYAINCPACMQNDKPSGIHKCFICHKPVHNLDACSTPLNEEGFGQKRICLSCQKLGKIKIISTSQQTEKLNYELNKTPVKKNTSTVTRSSAPSKKKTKVTSITVVKENAGKKTAKYLGEKPSLIAEQINFKIKSEKIAVIKNGSNDILATTKIDGKEVYSINTCAFDSCYQITAAAVYDWEKFRFKIQDPNNMMYTLATGIYHKKTTFAKLYAERTRFHYNFMKSVKQPDNSLLMDCKISVVQIILRIFENTPSCQILLQCNKCGQKDRKDIIIPVLYMPDIKYGHLDLASLSNLTMTSQCGEEDCTGMKETSIIALGEMVIFEIDNAVMDQVVRLDELPTGFQNPINQNENFRLVGAVNLIHPSTRRSCESDDSDSNIGHYTALCLRGTQWWEYNDLLEKPKMKRGSTTINVQILAYVKI